MPTVFASIGSNQNRDTHIRNAITALAARFQHFHMSPVYETEAVGFDGDPFYNLAVGFESDLSIDELQRIFYEIETANGRDRSLPRFSSRTLDIDLLLYGNQVLERGKLKLPRPEIYSQAFVLKPLADIAGDIIDPVKHLSYRDLWQDFDRKSGLVQIDFNLGKSLTR